MKHKCLRCGHEWKPKKEGRPLECPNCKSRRWDSGTGKNQPLKGRPASSKEAKYVPVPEGYDEAWDPSV